MYILHLNDIEIEQFILNDPNARKDIDEAIFLFEERFKKPIPGYRLDVYETLHLMSRQLIINMVKSGLIEALVEEFKKERQCEPTASR